MMRNLVARFKIRLLIVIVLAAVLGLIMQSGNSSKEVVKPVLQYMMNTDYDIDQVFSSYLHIPGVNKGQVLPAESDVVLKMPCDFENIEQTYGWHWSTDLKKEEFCPGMYLKVAENTQVKPILTGTVAEVQADTGTVRIKHAGSMESIYGGLKLIKVKKGNEVEVNQVIGNTGGKFYFELRSEDGPVNPQSIFK